MQNMFEYYDHWLTRELIYEGTLIGWSVSSLVGQLL